MHGPRVTPQSEDFVSRSGLSWRAMADCSSLRRFLRLLIFGRTGIGLGESQTGRIGLHGPCLLTSNSISC